MYNDYQKMIGFEASVPEFESEEEVNSYLRQLDRLIAYRQKQLRWLYPQSAFGSFVARECVSLHRLRHQIASSYYDRRGRERDEEEAG